MYHDKEVMIGWNDSVMTREEFQEKGKLKIEKELFNIAESLYKAQTEAFESFDKDKISSPLPSWMLETKKRIIEESDTSTIRTDGRCIWKLPAEGGVKYIHYNKEGEALEVDLSDAWFPPKGYIPKDTSTKLQGYKEGHESLFTVQAVLDKLKGHGYDMVNEYSNGNKVEYNIRSSRDWAWRNTYRLIQSKIDNSLRLVVSTWNVGDYEEIRKVDIDNFLSNYN